MSWLECGWQVFGPDDRLLNWLGQVTPVALETARDPTHIANWLRCGETWFAGVNVLSNDADGRVEGSEPLRCMALETAEAVAGRLPLDKGQVSVAYPGYPRRGRAETEAGFRFRLNRDAAHIDGLLPIGPDRRRMLKEPHAWVLGLPLTACTGGASPLVVWDRSHEVMRRAFRAALEPHPAKNWPEIDLTGIYHAARREVFETCDRIELETGPGEAHLLHRMTLHGIAPWAEVARAPPEGRAILYFRPELPGGARDWLALP